MPPSTLIAGTHHGVDKKHLQAYLDEFAYRFNRRERPDLICERCIAAAAACPPWTYRDIVGDGDVEGKPKLKAV